MANLEGPVYDTLACGFVILLVLFVLPFLLTGARDVPKATAGTIKALSGDIDPRYKLDTSRDDRNGNLFWFAILVLAPLFLCAASFLTFALDSNGVHLQTKTDAAAAIIDYVLTNGGN